MSLADSKSIYDADVGAVVPDMPQLFWWQGVQYTGQLIRSEESMMGLDEGYLQQRDFGLLVQSSIYPAGVNPPGEKDLLEFPARNGGRNPLRIQKVDTSQDEVTITYSLSADN